MGGLGVEVKGSMFTAEAGNATIKKYLLRGMRNVGLNLVRVIKTEKLSGQLLNVRTGNLRRAIFSVTSDVGNDVVTIVGADIAKAKYARIQEQGGIIRPVHGKYLTIPIGEAKTAGGVGRFTAAQLIASPQSYGYVGTFVRNHVLFGKKKGGAISPLFALKTSVTIKGVGYLSGTLRERRGEIKQAIRGEIAYALQELRGNK